MGTPPPDLQIVMKVATRRETVDVFQQEGYAVMATAIATKTDTPILEMPLSVQVVPQEVLQDQQVTRIERGGAERKRCLPNQGLRLATLPTNS